MPLRTRGIKLVIDALPHGGRSFGNFAQDAFGVRWSGVIGCHYSSVYTFHVQAEADERVRLWVANQVVVDGWESLPAAALIGTAELAASQYYPLQLDYWHGKGLANANLRWSYAQSPVPQPIPSTVRRRAALAMRRRFPQRASVACDAAGALRVS
jgi:hypothetical protein